MAELGNGSIGEGMGTKHWQQQNPRRRASVEVAEAGPPEDTQFRVSKVVSECVSIVYGNLVSLPAHFSFDSGKMWDHGCFLPASPVSLCRLVCHLEK